MYDDPVARYRAVESRDARFDGWFFTAVTTTGIYCRPSCPATTPKFANVGFFTTAAAAQLAGFRACKRCRPDATPGSPEWNQRADLVGRAMRLIADGVVDRDGVAGLARRLHYSERQLHRQLVAEVGAGPLALARAQRAKTARVLIETTDLPFSQIAFAAGFSSIRQFNETIRAVFAVAPSSLRASRGAERDGAPHAKGPVAAGVLTVRLPFRQPFDADAILAFLSHRSVSGIEASDGRTYRRSLRLPYGLGRITLRPHDDHVACGLELDDLRDVAAAVERCRRLLDLDSDPMAVGAVLAADDLLAPLVRKRPGLRVPGHADGFEVAVRAIVGQQVSVAGARTVLGRLVATLGEPLGSSAASEPLTHAFPTAAAFAEANDTSFPMPRARAATLRRMAALVAAGDLVIDPGADRDALRAALLAVPGIGPWTTSYIEMRALGDPDVFLSTDLGVRHALESLGVPGDPRSAAALSLRWHPWRSYAVTHLWASLPSDVRRRAGLPPSKEPSTER